MSKFVNNIDVTSDFTLMWAYRVSQVPFAKQLRLKICCFFSCESCITEIRFTRHHWQVSFNSGAGLWYLSKYKCILRPNWFFNCSAKVLFVVSSSSDESLAGCHEKNSFCFRVVKKNQRHGIVGESRPTARSDFYRWEPWRKELDSSYSRMNRKTGEELTKTQVRLG